MPSITDPSITDMRPFIIDAFCSALKRIDGKYRPTDEQLRIAKRLNLKEPDGAWVSEEWAAWHYARDARAEWVRRQKELPALAIYAYIEAAVAAEPGRYDREKSLDAMIEGEDGDKCGYALIHHHGGYDPEIVEIRLRHAMVLARPEEYPPDFD